MAAAALVATISVSAEMSLECLSRGKGSQVSAVAARDEWLKRKNGRHEPEGGRQPEGDRKRTEKETLTWLEGIGPLTETTTEYESPSEETLTTRRWLIEA